VQTLSEYTTGGKVDKVARYKWVSRNEPGKLQYVHKAFLLVDETYQRPLNDSKRKRIASAFNWAAFGVLLVARRTDGSLWVIDGQHRLAAAKSRSDIEEVPIIVFEFNGNIMDEATDFLVANKDRKPLTGVESFKAQIASGDAVAIQVQELVHTSGRVIGQASPTTVACIKAMYTCMQMNPAALRRVWPLIVEICQGAAIDNRFLWGMHWLEQRLVDSDGEERSLTETKIRQKLTEAGVNALLRSIGDATAYYSRGGQLVFARGILNILNYKRIKKLAIRGDRSDG